MMPAARGDGPDRRDERVRRGNALVAGAVAVALLAGCGGSSGSGSGGNGGSRNSGPPLSVSAWKQKVNSICASVTTRSKAVPTPSSPADLQGYLKKLQTIGNSEIAQLKTVNPPAKYADGQKAVIADLTAIWGKLGSLLDKGLSGSDLVKAAQDFGSTIQGPAQDYLTRTRAAGLSSCILNTANAG
jgi:hypothetical protein